MTVCFASRKRAKGGTSAASVVAVTVLVNVIASAARKERYVGDRISSSSSDNSRMCGILIDRLNEPIQDIRMSRASKP